MGLDFAVRCLHCPDRRIFMNLLLQPRSIRPISVNQEVECVWEKRHHWNNLFLNYAFAFLEQKIYILCIIEEIHSSRMSSKGFSLRRLRKIFHRGRNEHYHIPRRDHKQNNQHKMWHMQRDPNIKAAPGVFTAKHLEYFKMEIQVCPRRMLMKGS